MRKFHLGRPSPALIVGFVALLVAWGGTSYAAFKLPKNSVGTKQIKNGAVTTSKIKRGAVTSGKIQNGAVTASKINTSGLAVPVANFANSAATANVATTATTANSITSVTYVKGNVVDAPATGGVDPYEESGPSTATCPSGTVIVGTATHSSDQGVETSEADLSNGTPTASNGTAVTAFFDNFNTSTDAPDNYVIGVCSAVHSLTNPSGLAAHATARK